MTNNGTLEAGSTAQLVATGVASGIIGTSVNSIEMNWCPPTSSSMPQIYSVYGFHVVTSNGSVLNKNTNPFDGPVDEEVFVGDTKGNVISVLKGQQLGGSKDGQCIQQKDAKGNPTGVRKDGKGDPPLAPYIKILALIILMHIFQILRIPTALLGYRSIKRFYEKRR